MKAKRHILLADEIWLGVAGMHKNRPEARSFSPGEITSELRKSKLTGDLRPGARAHIHLHLVANVPPSPSQYRMLFRLPDGTLRLYRPDDIAHPARHGKMSPRRDQLPSRYHYLLDWYESDYCKRGSLGIVPSPRADFIERLSGLGKEIWKETTADDYVAGLRRGWR